MSSFSHEYKITPLSIIEFKSKWNLTNSIAFSYGRYLIVNKARHHYNDMTIKEWFKSQVKSLSN